MRLIDERFQELQELIPKFRSHAEISIVKAANRIALAFNEGNKVLVCGNGGSAADSQHFAAEFVNAFSRDLDRRSLPAIALSTDTSILTSIANDFNFIDIFSRQVEALGKPGDILVAITTSGSSENCIRALNAAKLSNMTTLVLTKSNAKAARIADISIEVPSNNTQHIQECHMLTYHVITELVENALFRTEQTK